VSWSKTPSASHWAKEAVDALPGRDVVRQAAPGDAGAVDVEDGVHQLAQVVGGAADPGPGGAPGFQGGADQLPPGVGQVAGIASSRLHPAGIRQLRAGGQGARGLVEASEQAEASLNETAHSQAEADASSMLDRYQQRHMGERGEIRRGTGR